MDDSKLKVEKLIGADNWRSWKIEIEDALVIKGVFEMVEEENLGPKDPGQDADSKVKDKYKQDLKSYKLNIAVARSILRSSLGEDPKLKIAACETPFQIWTKLHDVYEQRSTCRLRRLLVQLLRAQKETSVDMGTHLARMRSNWADLQQAAQLEDKVSIPECILIECIFESLPKEQYKEFNSLWDTLAKSERTVDRLEQLLLDRANREVNSGSVSEESAGLLTKPAHFVKPGGHSNSGKPGGQSKKVNFDKSKLPCNYCKELGHFINDCPKLKKKRALELTGGKTGGSNSASKSTPGYVNVEVSAGLMVNGASDYSWYMDTGAAHHITFDDSKFVKFSHFDKPKFVRVGSGELMPVTGKGDLIIVLDLGNGKVIESVLYDVWYVKNFSNNLFSLQSTLKRNPGFKYSAGIGRCIVYDGLESNCKLYGDFVEAEGLWRLRLKVLIPEKPANILLAAKSPCNLQLWHERMAHLNKRQVAENLRSLGYVIEGSTIKGELCEGCVFGKMSRHSFGTRSDKATKPGERIHTDLWGPAPVESIGGKRYYVLFKDEFSTFRQVYFLKEKSETVNCFKDFLACCSNLGNTVNELLSDNGTEFINGEFQAVVSAAGLTHRKTMPYTPQQNGAVERDNRTLMEMARSMLYAGELDLPKYLWAESVNTVVYVLNRTAATKVKGKTPIELWTGKRAPFDHLKVFGTELFRLHAERKAWKVGQESTTWLFGWLRGKQGWFSRFYSG